MDGALKLYVYTLLHLSKAEMNSSLPSPVEKYIWKTFLTKSICRTGLRLNVNIDLYDICSYVEVYTFKIESKEQIYEYFKDEGRKPMQIDTKPQKKNFF